MKITRYVFGLVFVLFLAIMPLSVDAAIPIPIFVSRPSPEEIQRNYEKKIKNYYGVYKLGDKPLLIRVAPKERARLEKTISNKRGISKEYIFRKDLDAAKDSDEVFVYDDKTEFGFKVTEDELKGFLSAIGINDVSVEEVDIIEVWEWDETSQVELKRIDFDMYGYESAGMDVPAEKVDSVKSEILSAKPSFTSKLFKPIVKVSLDDASNEMTLKEIEHLAETVGTNAAQRNVEGLIDLASSGRTIDFSMRGIYILVIVIIFVLVLIIIGV